MTEPIIVKKPKSAGKPGQKNLGLYVFTLVIIAGIFFAAYRYSFPKKTNLYWISTPMPKWEPWIS